MVGRSAWESSWQHSMSLYLESLQVTAFVTFATFLALFMDDARLACFSTSLDDACQYISLAIMVSSCTGPMPMPWNLLKVGPIL